jgi:antitoxin component YwqK of YwqJK toxin-antitoxin module
MNGDLCYTGDIKNYSGSGPRSICGKKVKFYYPNNKQMYFRIDAVDPQAENTLETITGPYKEYYEAGELKFEGTLVAGVRSGPGKEYYRNGTIRYEGEYKQGGIHGKDICIKLSSGNYMMENATFTKGKIVGQIKDDKLYFNNGSNHIIYRPFYNKDG